MDFRLNNVCAQVNIGDFKPHALLLIAITSHPITAAFRECFQRHLRQVQRVSAFHCSCCLVFCLKSPLILLNVSAPITPTNQMCCFCLYILRAAAFYHTKCFGNFPREQKCLHRKVFGEIKAMCKVRKYVCILLELHDK